MISLDNYKGFKIGDKFKITGYPRWYASLLNRNNPFESNITFPYYVVIVELADSYDYVAMDDGSYGWCISTLIDEKLITNIRTSRKEKILKINKIVCRR